MNKRGQSIIEYSLIAILVILGIVYMGPYVLRSVNAHFKLWDDGVQDSFKENIRQAPLSDMPFINANCNCWDTPGQCGSSDVTAQCGANQRIYTHNCSANSVQGCDGAPASSCQSDTSCCTQYWKQGCGTIPIPGGGIPAGGAIPAGATGLPGGCSTYAATNNCYYGQHVYATECSDASIACCPDASCDPQCIGLDSPGVVACPGTTTGLDQNYNLTYETACVAGGPKCQVTCASGYILNASHTACSNDFNVALSLTTGGCANGCQNSTANPLYNCTSTGHPVVVTVNTCSFQACSYTPGTVITNVTLKDISSPEAYPYCGNPGNPGEECQMSFTYH